LASEEVEDEEGEKGEEGCPSKYTTHDSTDISGLSELGWSVVNS
jgi:hypothetical protein